MPRIGYAYAMHSNLAQYSLRAASPADAGTIARHRALMFRDMGSISDHEVEPLFASSVRWLTALLAAREYAGWLALQGTVIVAGGGVQLRDVGPVPGCLRMGRWGHISNLYTAPDHRRHGLARLILEKILDWGETNHLDQITLSASPQVRPLYDSLGFLPTSHLRLSEKALRTQPGSLFVELPRMPHTKA